MQAIILFDFGSTFTKATVVSVAEERVIFTAKTCSTVKVDARLGYAKCLAEIENVIGKKSVQQAQKLATSSAAGGLRMCVCGLTQSLSVSAGKNVSFGAGAKIVRISSGLLSGPEVTEIQKSGAEIILLCGGYEGGNTSILLKNARTLSQSSLHIPVIYGGNQAISREVQAILSNKECYLARNIIPNVGLLDTHSAVASIRELFMRKIINMKGLSEINTLLDAKIMPTPLAVLHGGELLALGTDLQKGMGELMVVDVGGATTDICSYTEHIVLGGLKYSGALEPFSKRTVEGDLGIRESSDTLCQEAGFEAVATQSGIAQSVLEQAVKKRAHNIEFLAHTADEEKIDDCLAHQAIKIAAIRHCGYKENIVSANCSQIQRGKNLSNVKSIIGTGGQIVNSNRPHMLLGGICRAKEEKQNLLLPEHANIYIDKDYVLYAAGLLSHHYRELAFKILRNSVQPVPI